MGSVIKVPIKTLHLALLIGMFDLLVSEAFISSIKTCILWQERANLFRNGFTVVHRHTIGNKLCKKKIIDIVITICQLVLLLICIWLELSINDMTFASEKRKLEKCYGYERQTRVIGRRVPETSFLDDRRLPQYIGETNCLPNSLLKDALANPTALERGYPGCTDPFQQYKKLEDNLQIQGSSIGFVSDWKDGDFFLAYGRQRGTNKPFTNTYGWGRENGFAPTSFWSYNFNYMNKSSGYWPFKELSQRIIANVEIPDDILNDAPAVFEEKQKGIVKCASRKSIHCFELFAKVALGLQKQTIKYKERINSGFAIQVTSESPSYICVFEESEVSIEASWVFMEHKVLDVNRSRKGPVITDLKVSIDNTSCLENVSYNTARMYLDASARIILSKAFNIMNGSDTRTIKRILATSAVLNGFNSFEGKEYECNVFMQVNGSSIGKQELIVSCVYISVLSVISLIAFFSSLINRRNCPSSTDPLDRDQLLEQLRRIGSQNEPTFLEKEDLPAIPFEDSYRKQKSLISDNVESTPFYNRNPSRDYFLVSHRRIKGVYTINVT